MKFLITSFIVAILSADATSAATFTPMFDTPTFSGTQFNVESDPSYSSFYETNFGITVENSYLYRDTRDLFDGIGIANGERQAVGTPQTGRISFLDTTDFVTVDYASVLSGGTLSAFSSGGSLIASFTSAGGNDNGTQTLTGGIISFIEFSGSGGTFGVSGLTYNYDGTTDGVNTDIPPASPVPLPAGFPLLAAGLIGLCLMARRQKSS